jgi:hypothetical protein
MKSFFLSILLLSAFLFSSGQRADVNFGMRGGLNIASLSVKNGVDYSSRASFYLGLLARMRASSHFAIQPELYFSGQGGKSGSSTVKLSYLNIPVNLEYVSGTGLNLLTGPQLGILLIAKQKDNNLEYDIKSSTKSIDFSWVFGASYQLPASPLGIELRYNLGLSNINEGTTEVHNRVAQFGIYYLFTNSGLAKHRK